MRFLALDLNHNHRIDDGSELFGIGTTLPSGEKASNGFVALAMYDDRKLSLAPRDVCETRKRERPADSRVGRSRLPKRPLTRVLPTAPLLQHRPA